MKNSTIITIKNGQGVLALHSSGNILWVLFLRNFFLSGWPGGKDITKV